MASCGSALLLGVRPCFFLFSQGDLSWCQQPVWFAWCHLGNLHRHRTRCCARYPLARWVQSDPAWPGTWLMRRCLHRYPWRASDIVKFGCYQAVSSCLQKPSIIFSRNRQDQLMRARARAVLRGGWFVLHFTRSCILSSPSTVLQLLCIKSSNSTKIYQS